MRKGPGALLRGLIRFRAVTYSLVQLFAVVVGFRDGRFVRFILVVFVRLDLLVGRLFAAFRGGLQCGAAALLGVFTGALFGRLPDDVVEFELGHQAERHRVDRLDVRRVPVGAITHLQDGGLGGAEQLGDLRVGGGRGGARGPGGGGRAGRAARRGRGARRL